MRGIVVDKKNKLVTIQPGLRGRDLDHELAEYNLYTVSGTVSDTGVT
jgi:FAD/FMN-containing dehydrogenase